jgi:hypothetical protein
VFKKVSRLVVKWFMEGIYITGLEKVASPYRAYKILLIDIDCRYGNFILIKCPGVTSVRELIPMFQFFY